MDELRLRAYAKINLSLDVLGKIYNGYHQVEMLMLSIGIYDELIFRTNDRTEPSMSCDVPGLAVDDTNLVMKSARKIYEYAKPNRGVSIELKKRIPMAAGLGGGSADAAGVLAGLNQVLNLGLSDYELWKMAVETGADVPFCLTGGLALCEGIGEMITPLEIPKDLAGMKILIARPDISVSTPEIYRGLDEGIRVLRPDTGLMLEHICEDSDTRAAMSVTANVLEAVTGRDYPVIGHLEGLMKDNGAIVSMMSGSGPTVFGLFEDGADAARAGGCIEQIDNISHCIITGVEETGIEYR